MAHLHAPPLRSLGDVVGGGAGLGQRPSTPQAEDLRSTPHGGATLYALTARRPYATHPPHSGLTPSTRASVRPLEAIIRREGWAKPMATSARGGGPGTCSLRRATPHASAAR